MMEGKLLGWRWDWRRPWRFVPVYELDSPAQHARGSLYFVEYYAIVGNNVTLRGRKLR